MRSLCVDFSFVFYSQNENGKNGKYFKLKLSFSGGFFRSAAKCETLCHSHLLCVYIFRRAIHCSPVPGYPLSLQIAISLVERLPGIRMDCNVYEWLWHWATSNEWAHLLIRAMREWRFMGSRKNQLGEWFASTLPFWEQIYI